MKKNIFVIQFLCLPAKMSDDLFSAQLMLDRCPIISYILCVLASFTYFLFSPILTMMHLCIMQYAYWTPLIRSQVHIFSFTSLMYMYVLLFFLSGRSCPNAC